MNNKKRQTVIAAVGLLGILAIVSGVTVAWFSYSRNGVKENTIKAGQVEFIYNEGSAALSMSDAMPMTDAQGKSQTDFFDFRVASKTGSSFSIPYTVTVRVKPQADPSRDLNADYVKVWLSDQTNAELDNGLGVKFFQDTTPSTRAENSLVSYTGPYNPNNKNEKIIYSGLVPANSSNYVQNFRLRMWIDENTNFAPTDIEVSARCSDTNLTTEEACLAPKGTWTNGACSITTINNEETCKNTSVNTWTPATYTQTYPNNNKAFTLTVNVYAIGKWK